MSPDASVDRGYSKDASDGQPSHATGIESLFGVDPIRVCSRVITAASPNRGLSKSCHGDLDLPETAVQFRVRRLIAEDILVADLLGDLRSDFLDVPQVLRIVVLSSGRFR